MDPTQNILPQGEALQWNPALVGMHTVGDALIAAAYLALAMTLLYRARRESSRHLASSALVTLGAALFFSAALTHATEVVTMWKPEYGVSGIAKITTAIIGILFAAGP